MKKFTIEVPIVGYFWCEVVAEDENDAFDKASELFSELDNIDKQQDNYELVELNAIRKIIEGNVYRGCHVDEFDVLRVEEVDEARDEGSDADPGGKQ